jgi:hypothetical protein
MKMLIGQRQTKFWRGKKYIFERIAKGEWICVYQDTAIIPEQIISELGE